MGLGSIVYDVLDDYIAHASFQRHLASERSAALEHLHNLENLNLYQNSVIIFDRGYYSEDMFRYCVEHQHLCLMRLKQNYNIAKKCSGDIITVLPSNTKDGTGDIKIRVIEVTLDDGTKEYLATNLFDSHISQQMFRELYFYRWGQLCRYRHNPPAEIVTVFYIVRCKVFFGKCSDNIFKNTIEYFNADDS